MILPFAEMGDVRETFGARRIGGGGVGCVVGGVIMAGDDEGGAVEEAGGAVEVGDGEAAIGEGGFPEPERSGSSETTWQGIARGAHRLSGLSICISSLSGSGKPSKRFRPTWMSRLRLPFFTA